MDTSPSFLSSSACLQHVYTLTSLHYASVTKRKMKLKETAATSSLRSDLLAAQHHAQVKYYYQYDFPDQQERYHLLPISISGTHPTPIIGKPNEELIAQLEIHICANVAKVPLGQANAAPVAQNYLGLVLMDAEHQMLEPKVAFVFSALPVALDHGAGANPMAAQIVENNCVSTKGEKDHCKGMEVHACIANQIITTVKNKYISALEHDVVGYSNLTLLQFLAHLRVHYLQVMMEDLKENLAAQAPWNASEPIETVFEQIKKAWKYAADCC